MSKLFASVFLSAGLVFDTVPGIKLEEGTVSLKC